MKIGVIAGVAGVGLAVVLLILAAVITMLRRKRSHRGPGPRRVPSTTDGDESDIAQFETSARLSSGAQRPLELQLIDAGMNEKYFIHENFGPGVDRETDEGRCENPGHPSPTARVDSAITLQPEDVDGVGLLPDEQAQLEQENHVLRLLLRLKDDQLDRLLGGRIGASSSLSEELPDYNTTENHESSGTRRN